MEFVKLTRENIEKEHICCVISNNKDIQVMSKKNWLRERLEEGLVFLKGNVRGKCFIEYIPVEYAWVPIEAEGCMYIDCLWVSGCLKEMDTRTFCWMRVLRTVKRREKWYRALSSRSFYQGNILFAGVRRKILRI